jgi:hypothetical protein
MPPRLVRLAVAACAAVALLVTLAVAAGSHPDGGAPRVDTAGPRFTLVVVPDTQYLYDDDRGDSEPLNHAFDWIVDHRTSDNVVFTAALGDITQDGLPDELRRASDTYGILDRARVPYSVLAGNHDIDSGTDDQRGPSPYLQVFGPQRFAHDPTFGGASPDGYNSFHVFHAAGRDWLVLALDWRVSDAGVAWAQSVLDAHPHTPAILTTHELVSTDSGSAQVSDYGRTLWDRLIRKNDQIFLTLNGHFWPPGATVMKNDFGHDVQLGLANYQDQYYGGAAIIRTYAFDLARNTIDVSSFSPWIMDKAPAQRSPLDQEMIERTDPASRFSIPIDFTLRFAGFDPHSEPPALSTDQLDIPGTVALWRPQPSGSGAVTALPDASGHGNDLTATALPGSDDTNAITVADDHDPAQPTKRSLRFNGTKSPGRGTYLHTADDAPLNRMTFLHGYTIEAFVKLPAGCCGDHPWMGLMGQLGTGRDAGKTQNDPDEGIVEFNLSPGAELQWAVWPTNRGDNVTNWSHLLAPERWVHAALVNDGRFTDMYVDGSLVARNPFSPAVGLSSTGKPWALGASDYANVVEQTFNGWVGDVRIVDHALAPSQFMSARDPRLGVHAVRADLVRHDVAVALVSERGDPAAGSVSASIEVPQTGLRLDLPAGGYRLGPHRGATLRLHLSGDQYRALTQAGADGARVELTLGGGAGGQPLQERARLHLNAP